MSEVLYFDEQVTIYKDLIVIKKYYFPLATSKTILIQDLQFVALVPSNGAVHRWGVSSKFLNNWFPLDNHRTHKTKFIEFRLKGKKMRPSITPEDPDKVFQIIWQNFNEEGKKYVDSSVRGSSAGQNEKETEVCQQEMMEREEAVEDPTAEKVEEKPEQKPVQMVHVQSLDD